MPNCWCWPGSSAGKGPGDPAHAAPAAALRHHDPASGRLSAAARRWPPPARHPARALVWAVLISRLLRETSFHAIEQLVARLRLQRAGRQPPLQRRHARLLHRTPGSSRDPHRAGGTPCVWPSATRRLRTPASSVWPSTAPPPGAAAARVVRCAVRSATPTKRSSATGTTSRPSAWWAPASRCRSTSSPTDRATASMRPGSVCCAGRRTVSGYGLPTMWWSTADLPPPPSCTPPMRPVCRCGPTQRQPAGAVSCGRETLRPATTHSRLSRRKGPRGDLGRR